MNLVSRKLELNSPAATGATPSVVTLMIATGATTIVVTLTKVTRQLLLGFMSVFYLNLIYFHVHNLLSDTNLLFSVRRSS